MSVVKKKKRLGVAAPLPLVKGNEVQPTAATVATAATAAVPRLFAAPIAATGSRGRCLD